MERLRRTAADDEDPRKRGAALLVLGHTGEMSDVNLLALGLLASDETVVAHAKVALDRHLPRFKEPNGLELEELPILSLRVVAGRADVAARTAATHIVRRHVDALAVLGQLLDSIRDRDPKVREAAAEGLAVFGQAESVAALLQATSDEAPDVVETAIRALRRLRVSKAVPRLVQLLEENPKRWILEALSTIGDVSAVGAVVEVLRSDDPELRRAAALALGNLRTVTSVSALTQAVHDPSPGVRNAALTALGRLGAATLISRVLPALDDDDPSVRRAAIDTLISFKDPAAIPALDGVARQDPEIGVRFAAARSLAELGAEDAFAALTDTAANVRQRRGASRAKARLPWPPEVVNQLFEDLRSRDVERQRDAVWAFGERAFTDAARDIVPLLEVDDAGLQRAAAWALGRMRYRAAVPALCDLCEHPVSTVRKDVAWALGECRDRAAGHALVHLLYDADDGVSIAAVNALGMLRDPAAAEPVAAVAKDLGAELKRRQAATRTLGTIRCVVAYATLLIQLDDPSPALRRAAAFALSIQGNVDAASALIPAAAEDADPTVRGAAVVALAELLGTDALDALVARLADSESSVRAAAATALQKVPYDAAEPHLRSACIDPAPDVRAATARTIGLFGNPALVGALEGLLHDGFHLVNREVIVALGRVDQRHVHEGVVTATKSSDSRLRTAAARALAASRDPAAEGMLRALAEDEDPTVRAEAEHVLRRDAPA